VPIQIKAFGRKLFSGIFLFIKWITFCHTIREVKEFRELSKNAIKREGHRLSFSDNCGKLKFGASFCGLLELSW